LVHVDDMVLAGRGAEWDAAMRKLRATFSFGAWRERKGPFLGMDFLQNEDFSSASA